MQLNIKIKDSLKDKLEELKESSDKSFSTLIREWINKAYAELMLERNDIGIEKLSRIEALETELDIYKKKWIATSMENKKIVDGLNKIFAKGKETEKEFARIIKEEKKKQL